jgi:hypothetical protein
MGLIPKKKADEQIIPITPPATKKWSEMTPKKPIKEKVKPITKLNPEPDWIKEFKEMKALMLEQKKNLEEFTKQSNVNIDAEEYQNINAALVKMRVEGATTLSDEEIERTLKDTVAATGLIRLVKHYRDAKKIDDSWLKPSVIDEQIEKHDK